MILRLTGWRGLTFRVKSGPSRTGGSTHISFGTAYGVRTVPVAPSPVTREVFLWLTCAGGHSGNTATGTVRVECPEAAFVRDVPITVISWPRRAPARCSC